MKGRLREGNSSRLLGARVRSPLAGRQLVIPAPPRPLPPVKGELFLVKEVTDDEDQLRTDGYGGIVKAFLTRESAEAHLAELLRQRRRRYPFHGDSLEDSTSLPPEVFRDYLLDLGLEPPAEIGSDINAWWAWWHERSPGMSDWQKERIAEAMDRNVPYRLFAVPLR